jgi:hypothetical protein
MCSKASNSINIAFLRLENPVKDGTNYILFTHEIDLVSCPVFNFFYISVNRRVYNFFEERDH